MLYFMVLYLLSCLSIIVHTLSLCAELKEHSCTLLIIMPCLGFIVSSLYVFPFLFSFFSPFSFALSLTV